MIYNWYWNIKYALENSYFKRKYANLTPKIYYDRKYRTYVNPKNLDERGCAEYVCSEAVRWGVIYVYNINGSETHAHTIDAVFIDAHNKSEAFSISEEYQKQYSMQELDLINILVIQGKKDQLSYINKCV